MFTPLTDEKAPNSTLNTFVRLWVYMWRGSGGYVKSFTILAIIFMVVSELMKLVIPYVYKDMVDDLAPGNMALAIPYGLIIAYGGGLLLSQVFAELRDGLFAKPEHRAIRAAGLDVFKHLHKLGIRFHIDKKTGGVSRSIEHGIHGIERMLRFLIFNVIPTKLQIILVSIALWWLFGFYYAFVTFVSTIFYVVFTFYITEWRNNYVRTMNKRDSEAHSKAIDSLVNFETVKYFCNEDMESSRFDESLQEYEKAAVISKYGLSLLNIGQAVIANLGRVIVLFMAAYDVIYGHMTIGDFVLVGAYLMQIYIPLGFLGFAYREIKQSLVNLEKMLDILDQEPEIKDKSNAKPLVVNGGEIKFDNVSFHYAKERSILKHVSFTVPAGKTVAIVGESGAGKSTIGRLLFRFYDVTSGKITIDGQDIREVTQNSLRQTIAIVPQDTVLFNDTIRYNIAYGKLNASDTEIGRAVKAAHLERFISELPDGYNSVVGERGLKLSGGEKQRVAIARAFLKNPRIFLFDEATSSLDTKTEKQIKKNLDEISKNRTTLIIAHRLSTIVDADQIVVLDRGEVKEKGTHKELLEVQGLYHQMWYRQQEMEDVR